MLLNNIKKINRCHFVWYCTKATKKSYTDTIFLPKTKFPLRLIDKKLVERDENVFNVTGFETLYEWQRGHLSEPELVIHDGPPYANGQPHMGHAINKILKDTILRNEILKGNKVHYVPGWDCHGLPIELKALTNNTDLGPLEIRNKGRNFAKRTIEDQKRIFKSWGVTGDWKNAYTTYTKDYMKCQLRQFYKLYKNNLIYRDVKPVYWSPSSRTALAEAELEYNEKHKSPSLYLKIGIKRIPKLGSLEDKCYAIIWTTTPWTLPANRAICFNENLNYSLIREVCSEKKTTYIVATDLLKEFSRITWTSYETLKTFPGTALDGAIYEHPVYKDNKDYSFLNATHVSSAKGTGLVHCAAAHGHDDFLVALKYKLDMIDLIDDSGRFSSEAGPQLEGKDILNDGNETVLVMVKDKIAHVTSINHSYPYDWRTKKPVIIKASQQWFIDTESIKHRAVEVIENINILPSDRSEIYKSNFIKQVQKRPYWCISRQRKWGVPIPVIYNRTTSETILTENTLNHQLNLLDTLGTDFWWKLNERELLPHNTCPDSNKIEKCEDIMDIWLDSGLSWAKVLEGTKVSDMVLEGVDQFTGWFQSSLLTSVALRDKAPFKAIYVHGFAVDEDGQKMSKSLGNVVDPNQIVNGTLNNKSAYGIDALRWWVTCHANQTPLAHVSKSVLLSSAEEVQKIRSALRFAVGGLSGYQKKDAPNKTQMLLIDRYLMHLLYQLQEKVAESMQEFQFHKISQLLLNVLTNPVSALYYTAIKDRLYCDHLDSPCRRAAQFTLYNIYETVTRAVAPMLPHLAEESYFYLPIKENKTYFTSPHPKLGQEWLDNDLEEVFETILECRKEINRETRAVTQDTVVNMVMSKPLSDKFQKIITLEDLQEQLVDIFQVARVNIIVDEIAENYRTKLSKSGKKNCPRCRKVNSNKEDMLCRRCEDIVNPVDNKKSAVVN